LKVADECSSYYRYNETTFALELFALKDIGEGEEITISYVDPNHGVKFNDRYNLLGSQWGFECDCKICKSPARRAESDKRRTKINKLRKILSDQSEEGGDLEMMVECAEELLELYHEDGMIVPRAMTAEIIAYTYNQLGEADKAVKYGKMAVEYHKIMAGEASNEVKRVQELVDAPKLHGSWKPKSDAGDVLDEERLARDEGDVNADKADKGSEEDAVMAAVRAAMAKAKKVAREEGVSKETEDLLVEEAVKAALKQVKSE
jgi:tetratricopeptide (TPR) repeat protein